jgi:alanyl-tRNA synthetase
VSGEEAYKLHDTYGVLIDITQQMAQEQGLTGRPPGFRDGDGGGQGQGPGGREEIRRRRRAGRTPSHRRFPKYQPQTLVAKVLGWVKDNVVMREGKLTAGDEVALLLDRTNFYGEQGGQVGDTGTIRSATGADFEVTDTQRAGETVLHVGVLHDGELAVGDTVELVQTTIRRIDIMRNHTATHLLNLALKQVLGGHVEQKGSLVDENKTRYDFSHDKPVTQEQLQEIERRVNRSIVLDQPVTATVMPLEEAKTLPGVRAVFGEKYPDPVRVVMIGADDPAKVTADLSTEFCGGTHMPRTGLIGYFKILAQEGVAKGIRRITAVTGRAAYAEIQARSAVVDALTTQFQCKPEELPDRVEALQEQVKKLQDQVKKSAAANLTGVIDRLIESAPTVGGAKLLVSQLPDGTTTDGVRMQIDRIRQKCGSVFVVFGWVEEGKVPLVVALTNDLVKKGLKAGDVVKTVAAIVGGGGGGKPDFAQAGGKDATKLPEAIRKAVELGTQMLSKSL